MASRLKTGIISGINKGWSGFVWMLQIIIPISFLTALLSYSGWMDRIDFLLQPNGFKGQNISHGSQIIHERFLLKKMVLHYWTNLFGCKAREIFPGFTGQVILSEKIVL